MYRHLLAMAAVAAIAAPIRAHDAVVPDDFSSIQSAVASAIDRNADGAVDIFVRAGTYAENVVIRRRGIHVQGEDPTTTALVGAGTAPAIRIVNGGKATITGLFITNAGLDDGIRIEGTHRNTIEGNVVSDCRVGIAVYSSLKTNVIDNEVYGNARSGVRLYRTQDCDVSKNTSRDNGGHGFDVAASSWNSLLDNVATGNAGDGVHGSHLFRHRIHRSTTNENGGSGIRLDYSTFNYLLHNKSTGNVGHGLRMFHTSDHWVTLNKVAGNDSYGVFIEFSERDDYARALGVQPATGDNEATGNKFGPSNIE